MAEIFPGFMAGWVHKFLILKNNVIIEENFPGIKYNRSAAKNGEGHCERSRILRL